MRVSLDVDNLADCYSLKLIFQMFEPNLIKPPKILDDILSQDSENYTNNSRQKSNRPKHSSKENTIRLNPHAPPQIPLPREHDNQSVHSNASGRSKGKKAKQSTLARPKIISNYNQNKEEDNQSVHSNASKNSHKSAKKENTIMAKPKVEGLVKQKHNQSVSEEGEEKFTSFKSAWKEEDESVINPYFVQKKSVKEISDLNIFREKQKKTSKGKFTPFSEIEQQQIYAEDEPVIQLVEPAEYNNRQFVVGAKKNEEVSRVQTQSRMLFDESNVLFGQSKLRETKSRRRNIFEKSAMDNTSKVSQSIAESSVLGQSNRSKSKRREIFNSSREKQRKSQEESKTVIENDSNMISIGPLPFQSKDMSTHRKPSPKKLNTFGQLQKKVLNNDNDDFGLDQSKSDLNLSASNHVGRADPNDRDSLILHLEPEKKKGVSVVGAKNQRETRQSTQSMVKVNNNLVSKQLQGVKKLLSANQQYLNNLQHVALGDSYLPNNKVYNNALNVEVQEKPWHQIVNDYEQIQPLNIKMVERNEKVVNKAEEKGKALIEKEKLAEQERKRARQREQQERQQAEQRRHLQQQKQRQAEKRMQQQRRREKEEERQREIERQRQQSQQRERQQRQRQQREKQQKRLKRQAQTRRKRQLQLEEKAKQERERIEEQYLLAQKLREQKMREQRLRKQKQLQHQRQLQTQEREKEMKIKKLTSLPSQISREDFSENSQQSNKSNKKQKLKKENSLTRDKNHKVYVRAQSPRGEESFYQSQNEPSEQVEQKKQEIKEDKKPKLLSFEQEDFETKPKARTDINFYDNAPSLKSLKPPSSKPPLSKRTNGSGGSVSKQKKPKQKTIAITIKQQSLKPNKSSLKQKQPKKMSIMERAMMKHHQQSSNGSYSQDSYRNRDQMDSQQSRNSNSSKQSRGSLKKQSTLQISKTNMIHSKYANLPPRRESSNSSSHQEQIQRIERQRMSETDGRVSGEKPQVNRMKEQIINDRVIVSKNCTYIDERGRLVTQDLVIKGKEVYGVPSSNKNIDQSVIQRMKRSRQDRRSRSKSRQRNKLQRKSSRDGSQNESNQNSYGSSSFYENSSRATLQRNESGSLYSNYGNYEETNTLKQFIKPVQQVPNMYDQKSRKVPIKEEGSSQNQPRTLNEMFARKNGTTATNNFSNNGQSMQNSRSRKSLGRTEKTFNKK